MLKYSNETIILTNKSTPYASVTCTNDDGSKLFKWIVRWNLNLQNADLINERKCFGLTWANRLLVEV